jgi:hypothetical protein
MMKLLANRFRPSLPPVAVLMEAPSVMALRVAKVGAGMQPLVMDEDPMAAIVDSAGGEGHGARLADATLTRLGRPKRLCLVLGDPFFRLQTLALTDFPRSEEERVQVIRWHLRKTLNIPVESLRLRYDVLQKDATGVTLWLSACQEDAVVALESAFAEQGCEVGYVGASSVELHNLALARGLYPEEGSVLLLNRTAGYLSFLFSEGGRPVFFRCKESPADEESEIGEARLEQELRLTLAYHRDKLGGGKLSRVLVRRQAPHLSLPLASVLDEDVPVEELSQAAGLGAPWNPAWLPLVGLLEGN